MIEICDLLNDTAHGFEGHKCIFLTFKTWITDEKKLDWPVPEENFDALIGEYYVQSGEMLE